LKRALRSAAPNFTDEINSDLIPLSQRTSRPARLFWSTFDVSLRRLQLLEQLDLDMKRWDRTDLPAHRKTQLAIGVYVYMDQAPSKPQGETSPRSKSMPCQVGRAHPWKNPHTPPVAKSEGFTSMV